MIIVVLVTNKLQSVKGIITYTNMKFYKSKLITSLAIYLKTYLQPFVQVYLRELLSGLENKLKI